jgi:hypothetical protein
MVIVVLSSPDFERRWGLIVKQELPLLIENGLLDLPSDVTQFCNVAENSNAIKSAVAQSGRAKEVNETENKAP